MPFFRNVRQSGRLGKDIPIIYGADGWPVVENIDSPCLGFKCEQQEISLSRPSQEQPASVSCDTGRPTPYTRIPARRNSHTRRRDPGHIPRPRNAFIFFRSSFINSRPPAGEGQQNELSKSAGKVWNRMSAEERRPFLVMAELEKQEHQVLYPNYIYSPGRAGTKAKGKAGVKKASQSGGSSRKVAVKEVWSVPKTLYSSSVSSESPSPNIPFAAPIPRSARVPRAAAQRAVERLAYFPSASPLSFVAPSPSNYGMDDAMELMYPEQEEDVFVPTSEIPPIELSPTIKREEPEFDLTLRPAHLDRIDEQFGFKHNVTASSMVTGLPPMPTLTADSPFFPAEYNFGHNMNAYIPQYNVYHIAPPSLTPVSAYLPASTTTVPQTNATWYDNSGTCVLAGAELLYTFEDLYANTNPPVSNMFESEFEVPSIQVDWLKRWEEERAVMDRLSRTKLVSIGHSVVYQSHRIHVAQDVYNMQRVEGELESGLGAQMPVKVLGKFSDPMKIINLMRESGRSLAAACSKFGFRRELGLIQFQIVKMMNTKSVLQGKRVAQQYISTAYNIRHCSKRSVGGWARRSYRRFIWSELRFEVLFTTPIIQIDPLPFNSTDGHPYAVPMTALNGSPSSEKAPASVTSLASPRRGPLSTSGVAQYIFHTPQGSQTYTSSTNPWFLDLKGTRPEAKCTWLSLLNDASVTHLQIGINERLLSYDFMPDGVKKPLAQMDRKSFLTLMTLFQVRWQEGQGKDQVEKTGGRFDTPTGAGLYCEVTSHNLVNFGTVVSYRANDVQAGRSLYIVSEKARSAMFNRFDLGFHVVLTHSAEEVYWSVLALTDEGVANTVKGNNECNDGWSPGLAELIGCFAEPEMPKSIEHGTDTFMSMFSARSVGCMLTDYPVVQLLLGEEIEFSSPDAEKLRSWAKDYMLFTSTTNDRVTDIVEALRFASMFLQQQVGETVSWSESRKALCVIKTLDRQLSALCRQLAPMQPELDVHREFARMQVRFGYTLYNDASHTATKNDGFWRDYIGCTVAANCMKICSGLEDKYPKSIQEVRLMRGVLWHVHNANGPSGLERKLECSLNSYWLTDTSTIWID
ncbi:hypothetical protein B0H34DRAFT_675910 [Crassisporium funariophilum]|nr:hypothetical protein B0H34DRAFT_675910 [Crassisporium funariophilum]